MFKAAFELISSLTELMLSGHLFHNSIFRQTKNSVITDYCILKSPSSIISILMKNRSHLCNLMHLVYGGSLQYDKGYNTGMNRMLWRKDLESSGKGSQKRWCWGLDRKYWVQNVLMTIVNDLQLIDCYQMSVSLEAMLRSPQRFRA